MVSSGDQPGFQGPATAAGPAAAATSAPAAGSAEGARQRRSRRPRRRELFCPEHAESRLTGNGRRYFLHLLTPEELRQRGLNARKARLVIQAYPVLVLSNEWLEELWCPDCGESRWCHVVRHDRVRHRVRWAPRELWQQVAHVDPVGANPSVSEFSRREARRRSARRGDGRRWAER